MSMRHSIGIAFLLAAVACGGSQSKHRQVSAAQALTDSLDFEGGVLRTGNIPETTDDGVTLVEDDVSLIMNPDDPSGAMSLTADNPNEADDPIDLAMIHFAGADEHIEVPRPPAKKGAASGAMTLKYSLKDDVCDALCNRVFDIDMEQSMHLEGGGVGAHVTTTVSLDCRKRGDSALCTGKNGDIAGSDGMGTIPPPGDDAGARDSGGSGAPDAGGGGTAPGDAGNGHPGTPPQIGPISPDITTAGMDVMLAISGTGFGPDAVAYVDGSPMATTVTNAMLLDVTVPARSTANAGSLAVYVENTRGDTATRSNVLYLQVTPADGAPLIYDYSPDNGIGGDKILIIASNLAGQTLTIEAADGTPLTPGTIGTISWPTAGTADTVEVVLPDNVPTGPITVTNALGSYRGKIFSVGLNLTRAAGAVLTCSTEYNTSNWSRVSGADNLLSTSYFTAGGDCASLETCTTTPFYQVTFASAQTVSRIAMRGNREYASGYDFIRGKFEVLGKNDAVLWQGSYDLPAPDADLDITLQSPVKNALSVKFTSLADESSEPGFSELEVFGP
jgi:hypothetical protein